MPLLFPCLYCIIFYAPSVACVSSRLSIYNSSSILSLAFLCLTLDCPVFTCLFIDLLKFTAICFFYLFISIRVYDFPFSIITYRFPGPLSNNSVRASSLITIYKPFLSIFHFYSRSNSFPHLLFSCPLVLLPTISFIFKSYVKCHLCLTLP